MSQIGVDEMWLVRTQPQQFQTFKKPNMQQTCCFFLSLCFFFFFGLKQKEKNKKIKKNMVAQKRSEDSSRQTGPERSATAALIAWPEWKKKKKKFYLGTLVCFVICGSAVKLRSGSECRHKSLSGRGFQSRFPDRPTTWMLNLSAAHPLYPLLPSPHRVQT